MEEKLQLLVSVVEEKPQLLVLLLTTLAIMTGLWNIGRLVLLRGQFEEIKTKLNLRSGDEREPNTIVEDLQEVKDLTKVLKKHYLGHRIEDCMKIVAANTKRAVARQLPTLDDWHEREALEERVKMSVGIFYTLSSTMLIAGIVGTLFSLSRVLGDEVDKVVKALDPSFYATVGTCCLMVLRGIYEMLFERQKAEMDRYSIDVLIPCFQVQTEEEQLETKVEESKKLFKENVSRIIQKYEEDYVPFFTAVREYHEQLRSIMEKFLNVGQRMNGVTENLERGVDENFIHLQRINNLDVRSALDKVDEGIDRVSINMSALLEEQERHHAILGQQADEQQKLITSFAQGKVSVYDREEVDRVQSEFKKTLTWLDSLIHNQETMRATLANSHQVMDHYNAKVAHDEHEWVKSLKIIHERNEILEKFAGSSHEHFHKRSQAVGDTLECFDKIQECVQSWNQKVQETCKKLGSRYKAYLFVRPKN